MKIFNIHWFSLVGACVLIATPLSSQLTEPVVKSGRVADIQGDRGEILLDFSTLAEEMNVETEVDFSDMAYYYGFSEAEKPFMKTDLSIKNWEIFIPPASRSFQSPSYLAIAKVKDNSVIFSGKKVLGIRLVFPQGREDSYSIIPPFPLPFYVKGRGDQFLHKGVIKNVGVIKEIQLETYGQYYNVYVSLVLEDRNGRTMTIPMGSLNFNGWRRMVWQNPVYLEASSYNAANVQRSGSVFPPAYRFKALVFRHGPYDKTTDVVAYVKSIKVIYDKAWDEDSVQVDNEEFQRRYYNALDNNGFPFYKKYILERFSSKYRANVLKSKESFIKTDPILPKE